jgi:hypothetical protein
MNKYVGINDKLESKKTTFPRAGILFKKYTIEIPIQIGRQNRVLEVSSISIPIDRYHAFFDKLLDKIRATTPNRAASRLSVMFAIIQRNTVGDVVNTITRRNPAACCFFDSQILNTTKIKVTKDKIGIANIPGMPSP